MVTLTLTHDMEERLESLGATNPDAKARLAERVLDNALEELASLEEKLDSELDKAFRSGPARVWGDAEWNALFRGEYRHEPEQNSGATPPGWVSPRLQRKDEARDQQEQPRVPEKELHGWIV